MNSGIRVACLQMTSSADVDSNLQFVNQQLSQAATQAVDIVLLPENFAQMPFTASEQNIEQPNHGLIQDFLSAKSKQYQLTLIAGSVAIREPSQSKPFARCLVYDRSGEQIASYDKIHLFDVSVSDGESYLESATYAAGPIDKGCVEQSNLVVAQTETVRVGLSICYDLRFPELYRCLTDLGAEIVVVPAAFTYDTGRAHWQTLLRARAIENQVFIMAAAQVGCHDNQRKTWGHSMIIDPWGEILAEFSSTENLLAEATTGLVMADIELNKIQKIRQSFPSLKHRRL